MMFYAELPSRRNRQVVGDALVVVWIYGWIRLGLALYHTVRRLESVGTTMTSAGASFSSTMDRIAGDIGRVPIAGGTLREPFRDAAGAGRSLQDAGVRQAHDVHTLAIWFGILVAALPIAYLLARYLPGRVTWIREATAGAHFRAVGGATHLLAVRAAATRSLAELRRVSDDPMADIDAGRFDRLAALEYERLGLRPVLAAEPVGSMPA